MISIFYMHSDSIREVQTPDFLSVTELAGDEVSGEQIQRLAERYFWALEHSTGKDVVEVACGTGQGLGLLSKYAKSLVAGDVSEKMLSRAKSHYGNRVEMSVFSAEKLPFADHSKDTIIIFEATYYLANLDSFFAECRRVLRPGGKLLISTANKDLFDFNPSPYSFEYLGATELPNRLSKFGFDVKLFGNTPVGTLSWKQKVLRPIKKIAVTFNLVPKTMGGKKLLKKFIFGGLYSMPAEIGDAQKPTEKSYFPVSGAEPNRDFKVLFCEAQLNNLK